MAIVLNQLVYWTQRSQDEGWFYKTSNELLEETMVGVSLPTLRRYLRVLEDNGWLMTRPHPHNKWDRTTHYRINLLKLAEDLHTLGYEVSFCVEGNKSFCSNRKNFPLEEKEDVSVSEKPKEIADESDDSSKGKNLHFEEDSPFTSNRKPLSARALTSFTSNTEITTKTTNKDHTQKTRASKKCILKEVLSLWKLHVGREIFLTPGREPRFLGILAKHFNNDLSSWEAFCKRVHASPFLMGQGPSGWRITFDWILSEGNLVKILEGNFDSPEALEHQTEKVSRKKKNQEVSELLDSIEDPIWRKWCSELIYSEQDHKAVSREELKNLANARFVEVEDDRLVWIESSDRDVLNQIEGLRLKLLGPIKKTFPTIRNVRTRLESSPELSSCPPSRTSQETERNTHAE